MRALRGRRRAGAILAITASCASVCRARFLEIGEREAARDTEAAFVGTFHGFCARLLRAHPLMAGLDPEFTILDEGSLSTPPTIDPCRSLAP